MPGWLSLASLPAWTTDDRGLPGMKGDRLNWRERRAKNVLRRERERKRKVVTGQ